MPRLFVPCSSAREKLEAEFILNNVPSSVGLAMRPAGPEKSTGIISAAFVKDPTDPQWQDGNTAATVLMLSNSLGTNLLLSGPDVLGQFVGDFLGGAVDQALACHSACEVVSTPSIGIPRFSGAASELSGSEVS